MTIIETQTDHTWKQTKEGYGIRHTLVGTSYSILASGEVIVDSYGAHGRARLSGKRSYTIYDGERSFRYCDLLKDAKQVCERRSEGSR